MAPQKHTTPITTRLALAQRDPNSVESGRVEKNKKITDLHAHSILQQSLSLLRTTGDSVHKKATGERAGFSASAPKTQTTPRASKPTKTAPTKATISPKAAAKAVSEETKAEVDKLFNVDGIVLEGEDMETVPVFDTCDIVRRKIRTLLGTPGVTQARFCREVSKTYRHDTYIQSGQLTTFLRQKGPNIGCSSNVFYAAYVFFEKVRIRDRKKKTKMREEMEYHWGMDGMDRIITKARMTYIGSMDYDYVMTKYGKMMLEPLPPLPSWSDMEDF